MSKMKTNQMYLPYSGVGSRNTPDDVLEAMTELATDLEEYGFTLRTGGALGADTAFLNGIKTNPERVELYLPWKGYNGYSSPYTGVHPKVEQLASMYHPAWENCSQGARKLHGRNLHIVLGPNIAVPSPSLFMICYTPNAKATGGTGVAIAMADAHLIPVFDFGLGINYTLNQFEDWFIKQGLDKCH